MEYLSAIAYRTQYRMKEKYQTYQAGHLKNVFLEGLLDIANASGKLHFYDIS